MKTKHLRRRESVEPGRDKIYIAACGKAGKDNRRYTKDLSKVTCNKCLILTKRK